MANFAAALKSEVIRLARKEVRAELEGVRTASATHRGEIADLKRRVTSLEKQLARLSGKPTRAADDAEGGEGGSTARFSPKGFAIHRKRLGLSAADAGVLIGVSTPTIYGWEGGTKPRKTQMAAIAAFRGLGKREAKARLAELAEAGESKE